MKNSLVKKIGMGVAATGILLGTNSLDANAQNKSKYKDHDKKGVFKGYDSNSKDILQSKVFYNEVTEKDERFYVQHIDKKMYENDLDIAALPFYGTMPIMDFKTGDVSHLVSDSMYTFFPIKERSLELSGSHVPGLCDNQIRETAGVEKGTNYVSDSYVKDYFKKLSDDMVLELGDGKSFLILTLPKEKQIEGKTNQLYIPFDDKHQWGVDPKTKKLWVFGDIYQGVLEKGLVMASASTGLVSRLGENDSFAEAVEEAGKKETKTKDSKEKGNLYLIAGVNGNDQFWEGNLGIQIGPVAFVANYGLGKDENVKEITTEPSPRGIYGYGTEDNTNLKVLGLSAELHPLHNKKISPFVGVGINKWDYITEISEQLRNTKDIIKQNTNSKAVSENSWKVNGGINFKVGKNSKIALQAGHDSKTKFFAGARYSLRLGK